MEAALDQFGLYILYGAFVLGFLGVIAKYCGRPGRFLTEIPGEALSKVLIAAFVCYVIAAFVWSLLGELAPLF
jgi:hypothetical protein